MNFRSYAEGIIVQRNLKIEGVNEAVAGIESDNAAMIIQGADKIAGAVDYIDEQDPLYRFLEGELTVQQTLGEFQAIVADLLS